MKAPSAHKVLARAERTAVEFAPDPLAYKAFLSEFNQGVKAGEQLALDTPHNLDPVGIRGHESASEDLVTEAAREMLELMRRVVTITERGAIGVNENKLSSKMSGFLSTFFYNLGKLRGLKQDS